MPGALIPTTLDMFDPQTDLARQNTDLKMPADTAAVDPLLATEKLVKEYRHRRVVNGVSITVAAGEIVGLLGPTAPARPRPSTWSSAW